MIGSPAHGQLNREVSVHHDQAGICCVDVENTLLKFIIPVQVAYCISPRHVHIICVLTVRCLSAKLALQGQRKIKGSVVMNMMCFARSFWIKC